MKVHASNVSQAANRLPMCCDTVSHGRPCRATTSHPTTTVTATVNSTQVSCYSSDRIPLLLLLRTLVLCDMAAYKTWLPTRLHVIQSNC